MKRENIVKDKIFKLAIKIVKLSQFLKEEKSEYVLSKQLLSSGTSVRALIREADHAESTLDFKHKMAIPQKEINETIYWIELLKETEYLTPEQFNSIHQDYLEILKHVTSIIKSIKSKINH